MKKKAKSKGKGKRELVVRGKEVLATSFFSSISHPRKRLWLATFSKTGMIRQTSKLTKIHAENHYNWLEHDPEYAVAFDKASMIAADNAEAEVYRRGIEGYKKPISYRGKITDWYRDYSDTLAIFWLKGAKPERYRDNLVGLTANCPVNIQINLGAEAKSEEKPSPEND